MENISIFTSSIKGASFMILVFGVFITFLALDKNKWTKGIMFTLVYATLSHFYLTYTEWLDTFYIVVSLVVILLLRTIFKGNKTLNLITGLILAISVTHIFDAFDAITKSIINIYTYTL